MNTVYRYSRVCPEVLVVLVRPVAHLLLVFPVRPVGMDCRAEFRLPRKLLAGDRAVLEKGD